MLRRFQGKRRRLEFVTYDLEWIPGEMTERLVGIYDGRHYWSYPTTLDFLRGELTHKNRGKVFFAHAGGLADVQFILNEIIRRENPYYRVQGSFSGSSLIICRIQAGHNTWTFVDSYWLLRDGLTKIGASLGLEKGSQEYQCSNFPACGHGDETGKSLCMFYAPMAILRDYNALDCRILYAAIRDSKMRCGRSAVSFESPSPPAMFLFAHPFFSKTSPRLSTSTIARDAYVASRVEVFERDCVEADYFDVNSSLPLVDDQPSRRS